MADLLPFQPDADTITDIGRSVQHRAATRGKLETTDTVVEESSKPGVLDTAGAVFMRESVLASAMGQQAFGPTSGSVLDHEEGYNPYRFYQKNKESLADLEPFLRDGAFDNTRSTAQFLNLAAKLRHEKDQMRLIEQGSGWGVALGAGLSLLDVATLVPFAKSASASRVARAFATGGSAVAIGAGQEVALQSLQETRTASESLLNIGIMGGIGVGIGALAPLSLKADQTSKALDPTVPAPTGVTLPGRATSEAEVLHGSIGAAAVVDSSASKVFAPGAMALLGKIPGAEWLGKKLFSVSPVGRSTMWSVDEAREATQKLVDLGGIFTRQMEQGVAHSPGVEDLRMDHMMSLHEGNLNMRRAWQDAVMELGEAGSRLSANLQSDANLMGSIIGRQVIETGVTEPEFHEIVRRKLTNSWNQQGADWKIAADDGKWFEQFLADRGLDEKAAAVIEKHTDRATKEWRRLILDQEEKMIKLGMITEDQRLGAKYGHAQLWNRENVNYDREGFRSFLIEVFTKRPDEEWLKETHGMSLEDFTKLPAMDKKRTEILEEWTGDREKLMLERSASRLAIAEKAYLDALSVQAWADLGLKVGKEEHATLKFGELRAAVRAREAEIGLDKLEAYRRIQVFHEARVEDLKVQIAKANTARAAGGDLQQFTQALDAAGKKVDDAVEAFAPAEGKALETGQQLVDGLMAKYEQAVQEAVEAKNLVQRHLAELKIKDPAKLDGVIERASRKIEESETVSKWLDRAQVLEKQEARMEELTAKLEEVTAKRKAAHEELKVLKEGAKRAGLDAKAARKDLSAAIKAANRAEKTAPLMQVIDEIVGAIADHTRAPLGVIENTVAESGRVKDRRIILTDTERRLAEQHKFLHTDLQYVLDRQFSDVSGRLALRETFGDELRDISKSDVWRRIADAYERKIAKAGSEKVSNALKAEREAVLRDIELLRDRTLGRSMLPDDPESFASWGMNKVRQATYLRFAAGFPISSLTDVASSILHVGFGKPTFEAFKRYVSTLRDGKVSPGARELHVMVNALEMSMAHSTASRQFMLNELTEQIGIGARGTAKKALTGAYDRVANTLASRMNAYTGMAGLTATIKGVSGMVAVDNWRQMLAKYDKLSKLDKARLASVGIGEAEGRRLNELFQKYGEVFDDGFDVNAHKWHVEKDGEEMHRILRVALKRTMDRASPTPGLGDLPGFMSKPLGQLLFQFQSFGFGSVNRVLVPALQRGLGYGDARTLAWMSSMVTIAGAVSSLRAYMNGKDPADFTAAQWTKEIIDRGGLLAYTSPYVDATLKLTGMDPGGVSSRYRNNNWWHSLLGPGFSTVDTVARAAGDAAEGDVGKLKEKVFRLTPFNQWFRIGNAILNPPD